MDNGIQAISTNVDPPNSKVKEWELVVNKAAIAREKKENRRRGIRSRSSGEPYLRPDGRKAKIIFAQALA